MVIFHGMAIKHGNLSWHGNLSAQAPCHVFKLTLWTSINLVLGVHQIITAQRPP
jgi:hypothetical protein